MLNGKRSQNVKENSDWFPEQPKVWNNLDCKSSQVKSNFIWAGWPHQPLACNNRGPAWELKYNFCQKALSKHCTKEQQGRNFSSFISGGQVEFIFRESNLETVISKCSTFASMFAGLQGLINLSSQSFTRTIIMFFYWTSLFRLYWGILVSFFFCKFMDLTCFPVHKLATNFP